MYPNETDFCHALLRKLDEHNLFVQRIESGLTSAGIPDLFIAKYTKHRWVELKNMPTKLYRDTPVKKIKVDWRPGQQGWAYNYHLKTNASVWTAIALKKQIVLFPMYKYFTKDTIDPIEFKQNAHGFWVFDTVDELAEKLGDMV
jgi:hypothetical protein